MKYRARARKGKKSHKKKIVKVNMKNEKHGKSRIKRF
jgi:hypothetical protein